MAPKDRAVEKLDALMESVIELKELVTTQNNHDIAEMRKEIQELKQAVTNQNVIIVDLLSEIKAIIKATDVNIATEKYRDLFPMKTQQDLAELENELSEETKTQICATIKKIFVPGGLNKNLKFFLDEQLILQINVDGKHNKKRLRDYPKTLQAIHCALYMDGTPYNTFLNDLRKAFRLNKNRLYKNISHGESQPTTSANTP